MTKIIKKSLLPVFLIAFCLTWWMSSRHPEIILKGAQFSDLPGWSKADVRTSFHAFKISCSTFVRQKPDKIIGNVHVLLRVEDFLPACKATKYIDEESEAQTKAFFETWFNPFMYYQGRPIRGLFTGYYRPTLEGSLAPDKIYTTPLYGVPKDLVTLNSDLFGVILNHKKIVGRVKDHQLIPYYSRQEIVNGAIENVAPILAWVKSPVERLFLETEGSGIIRLAKDNYLFVAYAQENGQPYTAIAGVLIKQGIFTKETASKKAIQTYFETHPEKVDSLLNLNKSFVFFRLLKQTSAIGAAGIELTPGYSLAVDRRWIPFGVPLWVHTTYPNFVHNQQKPLNRLMIAQDAGGAINGVVRGDIYWGYGEEAEYLVSRMKNHGFYWLLLPKQVKH